MKKQTQAIKRFQEYCVGVIEAAIGPFNWKTESGKASTIFKGHFLVFDCHGRTKLRVTGRIVEWPRLPAQVYLYDPPEFLKNHRHGACLQLLLPNDRWFKLHFDRPARDFSEAYTYVEFLLTEAYNQRASTE